MEENKKIIFQMFDVKPVDKAGNLDLERIEKIEKILRLEEKKEPWNIKSNPINIIKVADIRKPEFSNRAGFKEAIFKEKQYDNTFNAPLEFESAEKEKEEIYWKSQFDETADFYGLENNNFEKLEFAKKEKRRNRFNFKNFSFLNQWQSGYSFAITAFIILLAISFFSFIGRGMETKNSVLADSQSAYASLSSAKEEIAKSNFQKSSQDFNEAYLEFEKISKDMGKLGNILLEAGRFIPYLSKLTSGKYLSESGKDISKIGILTSEILENISRIKNPLNNEESVSFLEIFKKSNQNLEEIIKIADSLEKNLKKVNLDDIPEDKKADFLKIKNSLPEIKGVASAFIEDSQIITDVLGGNGPRKYLFLFQNNNEMRPTGGFIGTYGVLDIFEGRIKSFFVDGIFNPDGQLREKIVPPVPIQKISAAWSLHDSNWFPDFPTSAEKARWFYEKTGGPTVDGVIAMTPVVMQKLLGVTGSIEMPEYGVIIDENNFMEKVQEEVEVNYDKELNQPKKILSDLAPKVLDKIFNARKFSEIAKTMEILANSLNEKQILIYANNFDIQEKISEKGWSGEILNTEKDYLSVINTNINGYKTDGVIEEKIEHSAEIQEDGTIIDEVSISRHHKGGYADYEWFNKVNADYMRVYVPKGSRLISAEGQTREQNSSPLDYASLGFKKDPQIEMEQQSIRIDEASGTRIYDDFEKTVFANWVYVSPQETTIVKYKYILPFKVDFNLKNKLINTYSFLAQKQSGSLGSELTTKIVFPKKYKVIWKYPEEISVAQNDNQKNLEFHSKLNLDRFLGLAMSLEEGG